MIQPKLSGRLGNFLFEVAAAYAYSLRHSVDYSIVPIGGGVENVTIEKYLNWLPNIKQGELIKDAFVYEEPSHAYIRIPTPNEYQGLPDPKDNIQIIGYFQSELYFNDYAKEVTELFSLPKGHEDFVSIHIRRGDYVKYHTAFPPIDRRYINPAIKFFKDLGHNKFLVFSDDIAWCKGYLNSRVFDGCKFEYSENRNEIEDLTLMSHCKHNIICNSTFSWWGAWLNQNKNKIVVSPHERAGNWFGQRVKLDTSTLIPNSWYKIKF